jgi:hypothetical protein
MSINKSQLKHIIKEEVYWYNWLHEAEEDLEISMEDTPGETWDPDKDKALEMLAFENKGAHEFIPMEVRNKYWATMLDVYRKDARLPPAEQRVPLKKILMVRNLLKLRHEAVEEIIGGSLAPAKARKQLASAYIGTAEYGSLLKKDLFLKWREIGGLYDRVKPDAESAAAEAEGTELADSSLKGLPRDKIEIALDQLRSKNISAESVEDLMDKIIDNIEKSAKEPTRSWILKNDIPVLEKIKDELVKVLQGDFSNLKAEGQKASKTKEDPPYREQGSTESQAQQMAAGAAYGCRKKRGNERDKCANKLKKRKGAAWDLYSGEITYKQLRNLAKLGQKVGKHKSKEPKHRKSLPGHVIPKKD